MSDGFAATAATYDRARRQLIPCFDRFYGTAVDLVGRTDHPVGRVLDLGAGTGLLTAMLAPSQPQAAFVLVDEVPAMLEQARQRLVGVDATFIEASFADGLPSGPFDAVVTALAVHHLDDTDKAALMRLVASVLAPGGVFVNAEQVLAATPELEQRQVEAWRAAAIGLGVTPDDLAAADLRMAADRCAPVAPQLQWLRDAGFVDVDAPFRDGRFAVITGRLPPT